MILIANPSHDTDTAIDILFRSTTDRLASHCRSRAVPGSDLNWKRLSSVQLEPYLSRPAGGQFSSFLPNVRPREARTSLISFSDLRPRLGVFSNSFSVRWIKSPM